jgi:hypothetical protein
MEGLVEKSFAGGVTPACHTVAAKTALLAQILASRIAALVPCLEPCFHLAFGTEVAIIPKSIV